MLSSRPKSTNTLTTIWSSWPTLEPCLMMNLWRAMCAKCHCRVRGSAKCTWSRVRATCSNSATWKTWSRISICKATSPKRRGLVWSNTRTMWIFSTRSSNSMRRYWLTLRLDIRIWPKTTTKVSVSKLLRYALSKTGMMSCSSRLRRTAARERSSVCLCIWMRSSWGTSRRLLIWQSISTTWRNTTRSYLRKSSTIECSANS